ncbi:MAG: hypothetical protein OSB62_06105 [Alphaproteobacteria bacterium]|nr:hypothetical protein [Alphaproteobacteria bacterium]
MMKHAKLMVTGLLLATALSGCSIGKEARSVSGNFCSPKAFRTVFMNNANLAGLYVDQEAEDVLSRMGRPVSQSQFRLANGQMITAWFYQINIEPPCRGFEGDYKYEPVFLAEGRLVGIGQRYYTTALRPHMGMNLFSGFNFGSSGRKSANYSGGFQERF